MPGPKKGLYWSLFVSESSRLHIDWTLRCLPRERVLFGFSALPFLSGLALGLYNHYLDFYKFFR